MNTIRQLIVAAALGSIVPPAALAQGAGVIPEVRSHGTATVTVNADLALVTIQHAANARTPAAAGKLAALRANAIRAAIIAVGIPKDSMPTTGRGGWWGGARSQVEVRNNMRDTVYVTRDAFTVRVRDLKIVGRVIDTALVEGAQTISNVEFRATDTQRDALEALRKATVEARARAQAVAEAAGMLLGRVLDITTEGGMPEAVAAQGPMLAEAMYMKAAVMDAPTTVVAPELKVTMSVSARWELVPRER
jgi:uncharacterized protein YggE